MAFGHPLAREARITKMVARDGKATNVLIVSTTLELDPDHGRFKKDKVGRLADAAMEYLSEHPGKAVGYALFQVRKQRAS